MTEFDTPPPLERGDRIAVVAPASNGAKRFPHVYELGLERLREVFDLEPVEYPTATKSADYLADHPAERARDVMDAFEDPEIGGVISTKGGNDQIRILEHLDSDVLRENPTRFYGYSDNTQLALSLWNLGIVSYYGPSVIVELGMDGQLFEHTTEYVERAFFDDSFGALEAAPKFTDEPGDWADPDSLETPRETESNPGWRWAGGRGTVEGRLWGGCLEILDQRYLAGRDLPNPTDLDGAILALETSEQLPTHTWVAGVLRAFGERGLLERFDGVLVGRPAARSHLEDTPSDQREQYRANQREAISSVFDRYNPDAPIVFDVDFGHTYPTTPIPIGARVEIDPKAETVRFD
ncbi:S66 family peptidase [Natronorubrum sp. DTA28]|uniref:S66 family peptidase n=1 Tax=Natronorubrum sp. DTA28 TaxID=3447019 RepID=UPI003F85B374